MKIKSKRILAVAGGLIMISSSANAALLCPPANGEFPLCYIVSTCTESGTGASGGGFSMDPGRCVGIAADPAVFEATLEDNDIAFTVTPAVVEKDRRFREDLMRSQPSIFQTIKDMKAPRGALEMKRKAPVMQRPEK